MNDRENHETIDPDNIPETLCDGRFNLSVSGNLATLTFTHVRPAAGSLFKEGDRELKCVVRARIVVTIENLNALRNLLNCVIQLSPGANGTAIAAIHR